MKIDYKGRDTKNVISDLGEHYAADEVAEAGYKVERRPTGTTADLKIEGRLFDVKTPQGSSVGSFADNQIAKRICQADGRFVVSLYHSTFTADQLIAFLKQNPIAGLRESFSLARMAQSAISCRKSNEERQERYVH